MRPLIKVQNLSVDFYSNKGEKLRVLSNINLEIRPREFVTLVGPSGCGKTTFLRAIAGFITPADGKVSLPNYSSKQANKPSFLAYVPQDPLLLPFRNVDDNIALPLEIQHRKNIKTVKKLLTLFNLKKFSRYYPKQLSGGMKQKVAIARALVTEPELLLMDEPFSSLDELTRESLNEELLEWKRKLGQTIIFVTHNIEEAVFLSNRVIVLSKRPSSILEEFPIPLSRKRKSKIRNSNKFFSITNDIRRIIKNS